MNNGQTAALIRTFTARANKKAGTGQSLLRPFGKELAATYSRGTYRTTTIGKAVFDGRVRNGNGSDHSFMATKNIYELGFQIYDLKPNLKERRRSDQADSLKTAHRSNQQLPVRESKSHLFSSEKKKGSDQAARPISISPLNGLLRFHA